MNLDEQGAGLPSPEPELQKSYYVHDGYCGWAYGAPGNPLLISEEDAAVIMRRAGLVQEQVETLIPPAQYATKGDELFTLTGGNRFIVFTTLNTMAQVDPWKVREPFNIRWANVDT